MKSAVIKPGAIHALADRHSSTSEFAAVLKSDLTALTKIGNKFKIRHHETSTIPVDASEVDYLFHRAFAIVSQLLDLNPS